MAGKYPTSGNTCGSCGSHKKSCSCHRKVESCYNPGCPEIVDTQCIKYKPKGGNSYLSCFIGAHAGENLESILETLDKRLCGVFTLNLNSCVQEMLGVGPMADLTHTTTKLLDYVCNLEDSKTKASASDNSNGYLFDKITVGDCLKKTIRTGLDNVQSVHIEIDFPCLSSRMPTCVEVNCAECTGGGGGTGTFSISASTNVVCGTNTAQLTAQNCSSTVTWFKGSVNVGTGNTYTADAGTYHATCGGVTSNAVTITNSGACSSTTFTATRSQSFTRNNCGNGCTGTSVTFSKTYTSQVSQANAEQLASNDSSYDSEGQTYANQNGTCNCGCTPSGALSCTVASDDRSITFRNSCNDIVNQFTWGSLTVDPCNTSTQKIRAVVSTDEMNNLSYSGYDIQYGLSGKNGTPITPIVYQLSPEFQLDPNSSYDVKTRISKGGATCTYSGIIATGSCNSNCSHPVPNITIEASTTDVCDSNIATLSVASGQGDCTTLQWFRVENGTETFTGNTGQTQQTNGGEYFLRCINCAGTDDSNHITVTNSGSCSGNCVPITQGEIQGNPTPNLGETNCFSMTNLNGTTPYTYNWNIPAAFGTGQTSSDSTLCGAWNTPGNHQISVTMTNCNGSGSITRTFDVVVQDNCQPTDQGNITGQTNVNTGDTVTYSVSNLNGIAPRTWSATITNGGIIDFPNGNSQPLMHITFPNDGAYVLTVTVQSCGGTESYTYPAYNITSSSACTPIDITDFSTDNTPAVGQTTTFTPVISGTAPITDHNWNLTREYQGNITQEPVIVNATTQQITFSDPGTYTLTLSAENCNGTSSDSYTEVYTLSGSSCNVVDVANSSFSNQGTVSYTDCAGNPQSVTVAAPGTATFCHRTGTAVTTSGGNITVQDQTNETCTDAYTGCETMTVTYTATSSSPSNEQRDVTFTACGGVEETMSFLRQDGDSQTRTICIEKDSNISAADKITFNRVGDPCNRPGCPADITEVSIQPNNAIYNVDTDYNFTITTTANGGVVPDGTSYFWSIVNKNPTDLNAHIAGDNQATTAIVSSVTDNNQIGPDDPAEGTCTLRCVVKFPGCASRTVERIINFQDNP